MLFDIFQDYVRHCQESGRYNRIYGRLMSIWKRQLEARFRQLNQASTVNSQKAASWCYTHHFCPTISAHLIY